MNGIALTQIKSVRTSNPELNKLLDQHEHLDINEKYNLITKLSQHYIIEKRFSNEKYELLIKPFFDDINKMKTRKTQIKRIYNNYDTYMYMVHKLNYGVVKYIEFVFNADNYDHRAKLMYLLLRDKIIENDKSKSNQVFRFINIKVIELLKNQFMWRNEDNNNLNNRAIILNLKTVHYLK